MIQLIFDILPPKARPFWKRNSGRIKVGSLVLVVITSLLATGYFYFLSPLQQLPPKPKEAQAAFGTGGATCTAQSKATDTSLACTVATENLEAGNIAILWFAGNNTATVDGNDGLLTSVTDSASNTWTVQRCFTNAQTGAGTGATTCIAWSKLATTLVSGTGIITANYASIAAKAIVTKEFTVAAGNTIVVAGTPVDAAADGVKPPSMTISGLASAQYLFVRATALERANASWTVTTGYTTSDCNGTTGGGAATNMNICGEFRILTGTGDTSDPTTTLADNANTFIAFKEVSAAVNATYDQERFWFLDDDGLVNAATGYGAANLAADATLNGTDTANALQRSEAFRLRTAIEQTTASASSQLTFVPKLQYSTDATSCTTGTWTAITSSSANIQIAATAGFADGAVTTERIGDGTGGFLAGDGIVGAGTANAATYSGVSGQHAEWEWALTTTSTATVQTTYRFRVVHGPGSGAAENTAINTYTLCPQAMIDATMTLSTAGTKTLNFDSGDTNQYIGAAFTFQLDAGTSNVTALTINETGTVTADVNLDSANTGVRWESGVASCAFGGAETFIAGNFNASDQLPFTAQAITATAVANFTCVYLVFDLGSGAAGDQTIGADLPASTITVSGETVVAAGTASLAGTTTIRPKATSIANITDGTITDGGRPSHRIEISGNGFGADPGVGNRGDCTDTAGKGCVRVGTFTIASAQIGASPCATAWTATLICFVVTNDGATTDWPDGGTGASGIRVTVAGTAQSDASGVTFFVYPGALALSVTEARVGTTGLSITGDEFGAGTIDTSVCSASRSVCFGSTVVTVGTWTSDTSITGMTVPNDSGTDITVQLRANNGKTSPTTSFKILPRIISLTSTQMTNQVREGDTFTINGDHFGAAQGINGKVRAPVGGTVLTVVSWSATLLFVNVPTGYPDTTYPIVLEVTRDGDLKTHTSDFGILPKITAVNPTSGSQGATIQIQGNHFCKDKESAGSCPVSPNRAQAAEENVQFGQVAEIPANTPATDCTDSPFETGTTPTTCDAVNDAEFLNLTGGAGTCNGTGAAWTDTEICLSVPQDTTLATGGTNIRVESNSASFPGSSNLIAFTKPTSGVDEVDPNPDGVGKCLAAPNCGQYKDGASPPEILDNSGTNETVVVFRAQMDDDQVGTLCLQVEYKTPPSAGFDGTTNLFTQDGVGEPACLPHSGTPNNPVLGEVEVTGLTDGNSYRWRARAIRNGGACPANCSGWVEFELEPTEDTDFFIDQNPPILYNSGTTDAYACVGGNITNLTTTSATINWSLNEAANGLVEYDATDAALTSPNCWRPSTESSTTACPAVGTATPNANATSQSVNLTSLTSGTTYYFRVISKDPALNSTTSAICSFVATERVQKTIRRRFPIAVESLANAEQTCNMTAFSISLPETSATIRSAFIEVHGKSAAVLSNDQTFHLELQRGDAGASCTAGGEAGDYFVDGLLFAVETGNLPTPFTSLYDALNSPCANCETIADLGGGGVAKNYTFHIKNAADTGTPALNLLSAMLVITYEYVP